jgi:hypothetical protein
MRYDEILSESQVVDLSSASVSVRQAGDAVRYVFTFPLQHSTNLSIVARVLDDDDGELIQIDNIEMVGGEGNPDSFETSNKDWSWYKHGIRLGTSQTRRVLRYVMNRIRQDHPNVRRVAGTRTTGARHVSGKHELKLNMATTEVQNTGR